MPQINKRLKPENIKNLGSNWISGEGSRAKAISAEKALENAKSLESLRLDEGWIWITVNHPLTGRPMNKLIPPPDAKKV